MNYDALAFFESNQNYKWEFLYEHPSTCTSFIHYSQTLTVHDIDCQYTQQQYITNTKSFSLQLAGM